MMVVVEPVIHSLSINPESEKAVVDQSPVVLRPVGPVGDGVKRFTHDADLRGMVVIRSLGFQLVPFKLHRFRKQRRDDTYTITAKTDFECFAINQGRPNNRNVQIYMCVSCEIMLIFIKALTNKQTSYLIHELTQLYRYSVRNVTI